MTKKLLIALATIFCLQSVAMASSRVDFVNKQSQQIRLENKAQFLAQLVLAEETLRELKANLAEAVDSNIPYRAAVAVRSAGILSAGVSALALVGLYIHSRMQLEPAARMINLAASGTTGISAVVSVSYVLLSQGVIELTGQQIEELEDKIQETEINIQILKTQITPK